MTDTSREARPSVTDSGIPPLTHFHHVGLTVSDVERSEAWYREVLGFQRAFVEPHHSGKGYAVVMNRQGTMLDIGLDHHEANEAEPFAEHRTGLDHLAIGVKHREDLQRWAEHFDRLGVPHSEINDGAIGGITFATLTFRDPDNIQLELVWMQ